MKKNISIALCLVLVLALGGCTQALTETMAQKVRGQSMSFYFQIRSEGSSARVTMGEGTATGLLGTDMCLEFDYHSRITDTGIIVSNSSSWLLSPGRSPGNTSQSSTSNHKQLHYRAGTLYITHQDWDEEYGDTMDDVQTIALHDTLLQSLTTGATPDGAVSNIRLGEDRTLTCDIAPSSQLGQFLSTLITTVDDNGDAGATTAIRATVTADGQGRLQQLALTLTRPTLVGDQEVTLQITVDSYGAVEPIALPPYLR